MWLEGCPAAGPQGRPPAGPAGVRAPAGWLPGGRTPHLAVGEDVWVRVVVNDWDSALLFRNGRYAGPLEPGLHRFWAAFEAIEVKRLPRRQWLQAAGADVVSADHFPLRLSLGAQCEVIDAKLAHDADYLVRARLALISAAAGAAAGLVLDRLVIDRAALARATEALIADSVPGCRFTGAQIIAVTMPPEVRRLFTDVERARRESEAALERARGEHAALRALANAARLLKGNPELMNLRVLQAVGAGPKPATLVLGGSALAAVSRQPVDEDGMAGGEP